MSPLGSTLMRLSPYHVYIVVSTAVWVRERERERERNVRNDLKVLILGPFRQPEQENGEKY